MTLGNLAQWEGFTSTCTGVKDVDRAFFAFDRLKEAIKVIKIGGIPTYARYVSADLPNSLVQGLLPSARDKTSAPSSTNNRALASAMPLDPPVMTAILPSSFPMSFFTLSLVSRDMPRATQIRLLFMKR